MARAKTAPSRASDSQQKSLIAGGLVIFGLVLLLGSMLAQRNKGPVIPEPTPIVQSPSTISITSAQATVSANTTPTGTVVKKLPLTKSKEH